ncbi:Dynamitin-domain-containing protein [Fennellomyces sp. T-0311]|nr:Dynamitin-domain-containing protein [Fennellomyces sp. T-0311]
MDSVPARALPTMASKYSTLPDIDDQPDVYETPDGGDVDQPTTFQSQDEEGSKENVSHGDLLSQISFLQSDLTRLSQHMGGSQVEESTNYGTRVDEAKRLIKQLEAYKTAAPKETNENDDTVLIEKNEKGDVLTYELFYTPETAKMHKESKVSDIDERIAKLESLVGSSSGRGLDDLPSTLATTSLIGSLSKLEQQITILAQPRQLETVARRVKVLIGELDRLNELKSGRKELSLGFGLANNTSLPSTAGAPGTPNAANENKESQGLSSDVEEKVKHLFASMEKVDPLLNLTPALLTRLKALQGLHTEAATFGRSVKAISEEQTRITDELKNLSTACELLNKSLKENEDTVNNNIKVIDGRMTELVQRVGALSTAP